MNETDIDFLDVFSNTLEWLPLSVDSCMSLAQM